MQKTPGLLAKFSRRKSRRLEFALAATLLFLLAAEGIVRLGGWGQLPAERLFTNVYDVNYEMLPGAENPWTHVREYLNNVGFRGPELSTTRRPGVARIVSLGDSTTFGAGVRLEETYTHLLQEKLRRRGVAVETLNAGLPGSNLWQQVLLFERKVKQYQPDLVLLYTCPNFRTDFYLLRRGLTDQDFWLPLQRGLACSHLYRLFRRLIKPPNFTQRLHQYIEENAASRDREPPWSELVKDARQDLRRIKASCDEIGAALVVLPVLPRIVFVLAQQSDLTAQSPEWPRLQEQQSLAFAANQLAHELDIPSINAADAFLAESYHQRLFIDATHFTPAGHRLMAETLAAQICERDLLPAECGP